MDTTSDANLGHYISNKSVHELAVYHDQPDWSDTLSGMARAKRERKTCIEYKSPKPKRRLLRALGVKITVAEIHEPKVTVFDSSFANEIRQAVKDYNTAHGTKYFVQLTENVT